MKLLVVDVQKGITNNRLYADDAFISNMQKLIDSARKNNRKIKKGTENCLNEEY